MRAERMKANEKFKIVFFGDKYKHVLHFIQQHSCETDAHSKKKKQSGRCNYRSSSSLNTQ